MRITYFSHSYRKPDAAVVGYFGGLMRDEGLVPVLDPPSSSVNAARLQRQLNDSDGMVAILTIRDGSVSPHIMFEIGLCLQARRPLLVFIEDTVPPCNLPSRILHSRFSRKWYFRQVREHRHALRQFVMYLGEEPPPRYQPSWEKQTCLIVGANTLSRPGYIKLQRTVEDFGYKVLNVKPALRHLDYSMEFSEMVASLDIVIEFIGSQTINDRYVMGALRSAFTPRIPFSLSKPFDYAAVPDAYQPRDLSDRKISVPQAVSDELRIFEQSFVELSSGAEIREYVKLLTSVARSPLGQYKGSRDIFIGELNMGDSYKVGQAGAVGPNAQAFHVDMQQVWNEMQSSVNMPMLAEELKGLRNDLKREAIEPEHDIAIAEVALAEKAARANDGPAALSHLKNAGSWAFSVAEKVGVGVATAAVKSALGL